MDISPAKARIICTDLKEALNEVLVESEGDEPGAKTAFVKKVTHLVAAEIEPLKKSKPKSKGRWKPKAKSLPPASSSSIAILNEGTGTPGVAPVSRKNVTVMTRAASQAGDTSNPFGQGG